MANNDYLEGSLITRSDGRLEYRVYLGKNLEGKKLYRSIYAKTQSELKKKIKEFNNDRKKYESEVDKTVFSEYALYWMQNYKKPNLKPVSYDRLEQTYNRVCEDIGCYQMSKITTDDLQQFINNMAKTKAYSTLKKHYEFIKNVFAHAYNTRRITFNPCLAVELPRERNMVVKTKKVEILSEVESDAIYQFNGTIKLSCNQFFKHVPVLLIMLNTGLRVGEMLALEWKDINFDNRYIVVNKTLTKARIRDEKGNALDKHKETFVSNTKTASGEREVPMNDTTIMLLKQIKEYNKRNHIKTNYVASTTNGGYVSERNLLRTFSSVLGVIGAKHYTIHSLRHTFASRLLQSGVDISIVSQILGHADINTTYKTYIHVTKKQVKSTLAGIPQV